MHKNWNTNPKEIEKKRLLFEKYNTKFNVEATISVTQVFVNAELFENGKSDSAEERQPVLTYHWAETDFN